MKNSIIYLLLSFLVILLTSNRCRQGSASEIVNGWEVWTDTTANVTTGSLVCGEEKEIYENSSETRQDIMFRLKNNGCDVVSAYYWFERADGSSSEWQKIEPRQTARGSEELNPGDKIIFKCTDLQTDDEGCEFRLRLARQKVN